MNVEATDIQWMEQALELAKKGAYTVRSNPLVGCVIVNQGQIVGEGFHWKRGGPHAEIHALLQANERARGATCYVTLEPCVHKGLTGPCTDALIHAGIKDVVIATQDPNPLVAGKGIATLKAAGIVVREGILCEAACALNKGFFSRMRHKRPYVRAKIAMSIDGRIAMKNGESQWITSAEARADVHEWRAKSGAILTTGKTVLKDNCRLTARNLNVDFSPPLRVIIDSHRQVSKDAAIFKETGQVITAVLEAPVECSADMIVFPEKENHVDIDAVLSWIAKNEINDVWVEAGPTFLGAMLQAQLIDEWVVYIAPKWLGHEGLPMAYLPDLETLSEHISGCFNEITMFGPDLRIVVGLNERVK